MAPSRKPPPSRLGRILGSPLILILAGAWSRISVRHQFIVLVNSDGLWCWFTGSWETFCTVPCIGLTLAKRSDVTKLVAYVRGLLSAVLIAIGGVAAGSTNALAGPDYCIREVPLVRATENQAASPWERSLSGSGWEDTPGYFKLPVGADLPLVYDVRTVDGFAGEQATRTPFWLLGPQRTLTGPYDTGFAVQFDQWRHASNHSGRTLVIGGRYTTDGAGTLPTVPGDDAGRRACSSASRMLLQSRSIATCRRQSNGRVRSFGATS
jgi:hypothetical protein